MRDDASRSPAGCAALGPLTHRVTAIVSPPLALPAGLGMWALALPGSGLLSLFVFICGFVPIAGVFLSTIPMGFVALTEVTAPVGSVALTEAVELWALLHWGG